MINKFNILMDFKLDNENLGLLEKNKKLLSNSSLALNINKLDIAEEKIRERRYLKKI